MAQTYEERLVRGLVTLGWYEVEPRGKYRRFVHPNATEAKKFAFVGKAGALRFGKSATESHSVGDPSNKTHLYSMILQKGTIDGDALLKELS